MCILFFIRTLFEKTLRQENIQSIKTRSDHAEAGDTCSTFFLHTVCSGENLFLNCEIKSDATVTSEGGTPT